MSIPFVRFGLDPGRINGSTAIREKLLLAWDFLAGQ